MSDRILILAGDSLFSYLLARPILASYEGSISAVALSASRRRGASGARDIYRGASRRYFAYRGLIHLANSLPGPTSRRSVRHLSRSAGLVPQAVQNVNSPQAHSWIAELRPQLTIVLNFDQIISEETLRLLGPSVNVHASRLPQDRGFSPAMWAFARGDDDLWCSIYELDAGVDTGPVMRQFSIEVGDRDTAFSAYLRLCTRAGFELVDAVRCWKAGAQPIAQKDSASHPLPFPNKDFDTLIKRSRRRLIRVGDLRHFLE